MDIASEILSKFTYETRHSSRVFCGELVKFIPENTSKTIDEIITDQSWFFTAWHNDPTISSMLTVLKKIEEKFKDIDGIWPLLTDDNSKIIFHLLPMEKLGLPDELYIKMNSRGKELTEFEYFKSQFTDVLPEIFVEEFKNKIDQQWSDLFWHLYENSVEKDLAQLADNAFLRFYNYITEIIIVQNGFEIENQEALKIAELVYSKSENCEFLFSSIEALIKLYKENPNFFNNLFYIEENEFAEDNIRLFFQKPNTDLFRKCADSYDSSLRINPFSIGEQLMMYACLIHLLNETDHFNDRLRIIRNLISNSEDTVRKENMGSLLKTVLNIVTTNTLDEEYKFNKRQVQEEYSKQSFIESHNNLKATINKIEDHHLLQGCLAILELNENIQKNAESFQYIFSNQNNYKEISYALLTFGDYSQKYDWRRRLGNNNNSTWRELLTPSNRRENFNTTRQILNDLVQYVNVNPETDLNLIVANYLKEHTSSSENLKTWQYYYLKYELFSKNEEGFIHWPQFHNQYDNKLMRKTTLGGFNWSPYLVILKEYFGDKLSLENYGVTPLTLTKKNASLKIYNRNEGFTIEAYEDMNSIALLEEIRKKEFIDDANVFKIKQNQDNIDLEDRIIKGIEMIEGIIGF